MSRHSGLTAAAQGSGEGVLILGAQRLDELGNRLPLRHRADALAGAPDVLPRLRAGGGFGAIGKQFGLSGGGLGY